MEELEVLVFFDMNRKGLYLGMFDGYILSIAIGMRFFCFDCWLFKKMFAYPRYILIHVESHQTCTN